MARHAAPCEELGVAFSGENGWTGGQYSLVRALFGAYLCWVLVTLTPDDALRYSGAFAAICFAAGFFDRAAAIWCLGLVGYLALGRPALLCLAGPLLLNLALPPAPYGTVAAIGRTDPDGGWRFPPTLFGAVWIAMAALYAYLGYAHFSETLVLSARLVLGIVLLHFYAFKPAWVRGVRPVGKETLFYDGACGLCHRAVRFMLAEDRDPATLAFAPLQGETFAALGATELPDTMVLRCADGRLLLRSASALHLGARLGGYWRLLAALARIVPRSLADFAYDRVAAVRHRLFTRPTDACPILPPALRSRMLP